MARRRRETGRPGHTFLETELIRGRNLVDAVLREATDELQAYLGAAR